jgi:hypothetical protein
VALHVPIDSVVLVGFWKGPRPEGGEFGQSRQQVLHYTLSHFWIQTVFLLSPKLPGLIHEQS